MDTSFKVEDLPSVGGGFFSNKMDELLEKSEETRSTAHSLG